MNNLALFDLDNTLLSCDSDVAWATYLVEKKIVNQDDYIKKRELFYDLYLSGDLDIEEYLKFQLLILSKYTKAELQEMHKEFMEKYIINNMPNYSFELVNHHQHSGDVVAVVSATNEFIITPIVEKFGIKNIMGIELEEDSSGNYTGKHKGILSFREGKVIRVKYWLNSIGKTFNDFEKTYFYSDSHNDLPLLNEVSHPIAVNPDDILRNHALNKKWQILDFKI